jgi:polyisoprenyl-teichoic acid--peptidoglycan teichoic acid transferase
MFFHGLNSKVICFLLPCLLLAGCGFPSMAKPAYAAAELLLTPNPNIPATPTPFQPVFQDLNSLGNFSGTPIPGSSNQPASISAASHRINILVLGSDWRPNSGYRTDVILLVSLDKIHGNVSVVSFPRDLWVKLPGQGEERINTSMEYGGFPLTRDMFLENFGVKTDHFVITNFQGFVALVNYLGGLNVNVGRELYDTCNLPQAVNGYCYVAPGTIPMDGLTTLWYVRSRGTTSDFDRARRSQEVLQAIVTKLVSIDAVTNASQIYSSLASAVETDLSLSDILNYLPLAPKILAEPEKVRQYFIGAAETYGYVIPSTGANVLLPNLDAIMSILNQALSD